MSTIKNIEEQIIKQQQELTALKAKLEEERLKSPDTHFATELHSLLCTFNHIDGCGWFYEFKDKKDDWTGHVHVQYLKKAQNLIHRCDKEGIKPEDAIRIFKMVREK